MTHSFEWGVDASAGGRTTKLQGSHKVDWEKMFNIIFGGMVTSRPVGQASIIGN
jgi:hypothetical protein